MLPYGHGYWSGGPTYPNLLDESSLQSTNTAPNHPFPDGPPGPSGNNSAPNPNVYWPTHPQQLQQQQQVPEQLSHFSEEDEELRLHESQQPTHPSTEQFHRVPLGEKGRMELKAAIRAAVKDRPGLRDQ